MLRVRALSGKSDAPGARLRLIAGERSTVGVVLPGASYMSSAEPWVSFGLGSAASAEPLEVRWPDGSVERFDVARVDTEMLVKKGEGQLP